MTAFSKQLLSTPYLYWIGRRIFGQLGWLGVLGIVLIVASTIYLAKSYAVTADINHKKTVLAKKQLLAERPVSNQSFVVSQDPVANLSRLYAAFPNKSDLSASLLVLKQKSTQHKIALNEGRYKYTLVTQDENSTHFAKYEIEFPVKGHYINIRTFINDVLLQLPTLALQELHLQRENVVDRNIEADLSFVLFVKGEL